MGCCIIIAGFFWFCVGLFDLLGVPGIMLISGLLAMTIGRSILDGD